MKKILIVSYLFAPANAIGAIRPTKFAKYLIRMGFQVDVIAGRSLNIDDELLKKDAECINNLHAISHSDYYMNLRKKVKKEKNTSNDVVQITNQVIESRENKLSFFSLVRTILRNNYRKVLELLCDYDFYFQSKSYIKNHIDLTQYDIVISSYGPLGSHLLGLWIKKKIPDIKWLVDFRDPIIIENNPFIFKGLMKYLNSKFYSKSDKIIAVSNGYLDKITNGNNEKGIVITNGYDKEDLSVCNNIKPNDKLTFIYTGAMYEGKRDLSMLFEVLEELIKQRKIDFHSIEFNYAGKDYEAIINQAKKYNLEKIIINHGYVDRGTSLQLQKNSDILVVCSWNLKNYQGVIPGKYLEYMAIEKPIVSIVTGDTSNSEIKRITKKCNNGLCCEISTIQEDKILLQNLLLEYYNQKLIQGKVIFNPNTKEVEKYNYELLTERLIALF